MTFGVNNFNLELITLIHKQFFKSNTKNADHSIGSYKESENIIHKFKKKLVSTNSNDEVFNFIYSRISRCCIFVGYVKPKKSIKRKAEMKVFYT